MFSLVSVCLSTPPARQATYAAGGMPLVVSQEDFLVHIVFTETCSTSQGHLKAIDVKVILRSSCKCLYFVYLPHL